MLRRLLPSLLALGALSGCGGEAKSTKDERPPGFNSAAIKSQGGAPSAADSDPECEKPPKVDTDDSCADETFQLVEIKPTVYFVLDTSGSMSDDLLTGNSSKLKAAKESLSTVAKEIGHRLKYGLTAFPGPDTIDPDLDPDAPPPLYGCAAGEELFPIQNGDKIRCLNHAPGGPILDEFEDIVGGLEAFGGTPLHPTLEAIAPKVLGQEGTTAIVLVTDGSPNCNPEVECEADECGYNLAQLSYDDVACDEDFNCCDPSNVPMLHHPQASCVDIDESVKWVEYLNGGGVTTYVVGVLGDENFDDAMNRLAVAGGAPRSGDRAYYDVESLEELTDTVRIIGSELAQKCEIQLADPPPFLAEMNVYFDGKVVPSDTTDGWTYLGDATVQLHGKYCDQVQKGNVNEVQLVAGCATIIK